MITFEILSKYIIHIFYIDLDKSSIKACIHNLNWLQRLISNRLLALEQH